MADATGDIKGAGWPEMNDAKIYIVFFFSFWKNTTI